MCKVTLYNLPTKTMKQILRSDLCESATGCIGASDYLQYARQQGYPYCAVLDWSSSAGDWSFVVSQDGITWQLMTQTNNYPRRGFSHVIHDDAFFDGTEEEAVEYFTDLYFVL